MTVNVTLTQRRMSRMLLLLNKQFGQGSVGRHGTLDNVVTYVWDGHYWHFNYDDNDKWVQLALARCDKSVTTQTVIDLYLELAQKHPTHICPPRNV